MTYSFAYFGAALLTVIGLVGGLAGLWPGRFARKSAFAPRLAQSETPVFLFENDFMLDASSSAAALIADRSRDTTEFEALMQVLDGRFPDLRNRVSALEWNADDTVLSGQDGALCIRLKNENGLTRISLEAPETNDAAHKYEALERAAQMAELDLLRTVARETPQLIWQEDRNGNLTWANSAYLSTCDRVRSPESSSNKVWPGSRLFAELEYPSQDAVHGIESRHSLRFHGEASENWFTVTAQTLKGSVVFFATNVNDTVRAEHAQKEFLQTLSKTFAQLSTGLAIFDKQRRLTMFNPALLDMFGLPFAFMSARPTLETLLDRLREMRKLPEPRDYLEWRDGVTRLESGENGGVYSERWDLPDGLTFRVTGRPHPNGALAFLFEDISAEVSLTQRFRVEIETGQAVLDEIEDAIAVFSSANTLVMTNRAYRDLWQEDNQSAFRVQDLRSALRVWKSRSATSSVWRKIEGLRQGGTGAAPFSDTVALTDGRQLICSARRLTGGMTLVRFRQAVVPGQDNSKGQGPTLQLRHVSN